MTRHGVRAGVMVLGVFLLVVGCSDGDGAGSFGDYVATVTIGGDCERTENRGADVELFGRNIIVTFYTPEDFEDCVGGFGWDWDGNLDTGMEQFVAGPCLLGLAVDFPPQNVLPVEDRAFSSIRANADGSYTIHDGAGAIENAELSGYVCEGPLTIEIQPR